MAERVLVTGHDGYIGSVMAPLLQEAGYDVTGLDTGYFHECTLGDQPVEVPNLKRDLRDVRAGDLEGVDAVVHLGALSNDPIGNLNGTWTREINLEASVRLARLAKSSGASRFLFSSSCIMYGMSEAAVVTEDSPLDPKTEYARSKVAAEREIAKLADQTFSPVFLRNGTVYGVSPRMRLDTVLNDLVGQAVTTGRIVIHSDGTPWRPVVHIRDVARSFQAVLEAPREAIHNQAFNNGANHLNHRVIDLARMVQQAVHGCTLEVRAEPGADQRTYQADFGKFARTFPRFRFQYSPADGAKEMRDALRRIGFGRDAYEDGRFVRMRWLRGLLDAGKLDPNLRWKNGAGA